MSNPFKAASEVRDLGRDLLYGVDRLSLDPGASAQIYKDAIIPRLRAAEERLAECFDLAEKKSAQSEDSCKSDPARKIG